MTRTKSQLQAGEVGLDPRTLGRPIDWARLYGNPNPVEIEIGMGKGTFLMDQATLRPDVNFLGIEWSHRCWRYASDRFRRAGFGNVRTLHAEAFELIAKHVARDTVSALHIYFPDPWPRRKHRKRRLVTALLLEEIARVLVPGGPLRIVTDHAEYFASIARLVEASSLVVVPFESPLTRGEPGADELVGTNFERKYRREGRSFHALAAVPPSRVE